MELFSSEDEEVKVSRDTYDDFETAPQRKVYGTRSSLLPRYDTVEN